LKKNAAKSSSGGNISTHDQKGNWQAQQTELGSSFEWPGDGKDKILDRTAVEENERVDTYRRKKKGWNGKGGAASLGLRLTPTGGGSK